MYLSVSGLQMPVYGPDRPCGVQEQIATAGDLQQAGSVASTWYEGHPTPAREGDVSVAGSQ